MTHLPPPPSPPLPGTPHSSSYLSFPPSHLLLSFTPVISFSFYHSVPPFLLFLSKTPIYSPFLSLPFYPFLSLPFSYLPFFQLPFPVVSLPSLPSPDFHPLQISSRVSLTRERYRWTRSKVGSGVSLSNGTLTSQASTQLIHIFLPVHLLFCLYLFNRR